MQKLRYRVYPSLLNQFSLYLSEEGFERDDEHIPFVDFARLMDAINRVPTPTTEAQAKGIAFEELVLGAAQSEEPESPVVARTRQLLPPVGTPQVYCEYQLDDVLIYGYADFVGFGRCVDIKTTKQYQFPKFLHSHQNWYMKALEPDGVKRMDYIITDFREVYRETYTPDTYDFGRLAYEVFLFRDFLEQHREQITQPKLFNHLELAY
jgi:hypothetical protein